MAIVLVAGLALLINTASGQVPSQQQLQRWLKRFPQADTDKNGKLSIEEATAFMQKMRGRGGNSGAPQEFEVDPGWDKERFPEHAVSYKTPDEIREIYEQGIKRGQPAVVSYDKPTDGAMRIVATGHSFMAPGFRTFPVICKAAGMEQPLYTHTGGGITGSARYKWEQENGIFQFDGRPTPKLLASISNASWDAMMWGPYFNDRSKYYSCWIDFCLKYNPDMKFYLSDAWPQLYQLGQNPKSESYFTAEVFDKMAKDRRVEYEKQVSELLEQYPDRVFILPTCDAMALAGKAYLRGELPGIDGIHKVIGGKERSLWRDQLGHLGPGFDRLEGYVFYATIYKKSPELIEGDIPFGDRGNFPSRELDRQFRKIAWQAALAHPLSGVKDQDGDKIGDAD
ncbi:MAG: hypothetical protein AAFX06_18140 [Planctomycetota bacterium]